jgi:hypothetical protein
MLERYETRVMARAPTVGSGEDESEDGSEDGDQEGDGEVSDEADAVETVLENSMRLPHVDDAPMWQVRVQVKNI